MTCKCIVCEDVNGTFIRQCPLCAAAPDLLVSLQEMVADLISHASLGLNENEVAMLRRAETALAKAEGTACD